MLIDGDTDLGYVEDGTACGTDSICFDQKCLPIQQFNFSTCPGTTDKIVCSGHGVNTHTRAHACATIHSFRVLLCELKSIKLWYFIFQSVKKLNAVLWFNLITKHDPCAHSAVLTNNCTS